MFDRQQVTQFDSLALVHPFFDLQRLLFGFVFPLELFYLFVDGFLLLFMVQGEVNRSSHIALPDVGYLLLAHFRFSADVVQDIVHNLERQSEMLPHPETLYLMLGV